MKSRKRNRILVDCIYFAIWDWNKVGVFAPLSLTGTLWSAAEVQTLIAYLDGVEAIGNRRGAASAARRTAGSSERRVRRR